MSSYFFIPEYHSIVWIYNSLFTDSLLKVIFSFWNKSAIHTCMHFFFNEDVIFKSGKNLRAKLLDCMGKLCLTSHTGFYVDISSTKLFFKVFISDCILISFVWLFQLFCIFSQYLVFSFYLFYFSHSNTWVAISIFKFHFCDD